MSCIIFYEKPGCATNNLQKHLLRSSGLQVDARNLLHEPWTRERLRPYFGNTPVAEWFNPAAPAIKYGELDPQSLGSEEALQLMLAQPLLIRRPLIRCGKQFMSGFSLNQLNELLPCKGKLQSFSVALQGCSHGHASHSGCQAKEPAC